MNGTVKKYVDEKDVEGLKYIFKDALDVDPSFNKYLEEYNYVAKNGLFEAHQNLSGFSNNKSEWDKSYWIKLKRELLENFSKERMNHMRDVAKVLYADKLRQAQEAAKVEAKTSTPPPTPQTETKIVKETATAAKPSETREEYEKRIAKEIEEEKRKLAQSAPKVESSETISSDYSDIQKKKTRPTEGTRRVGKRNTRQGHQAPTGCLTIVVATIIATLAIMILLLH